MEGRITEIIEKPRIDRHASGTKHPDIAVPAMKPIEMLLRQLGPKAVFGDPVQTGDTTVIPVAEVRTSFGGGQGRNAGPAPERATEEAGSSGGGAGARVVPRGYLCITGEKVRFEPIIDATRLALAGMALAAWLTFVLSKTR